MTTWTIQLHDGRTAQVQADEITTRQDGALFVMKAVAKPPAALVVVAAFARGVWQSCWPDSTAVLWLDQPATAKVEKPKRGPYIMPSTPAP